MDFIYTDAVKGGLLIGFAISLMLLFNGRLTGISNILSRIVLLEKSALSLRALFLFGLLLGGAYMSFQHQELFVNESDRTLFALAVAGVFVGFGTAMGSGCTSGHGICGVARFSKRSILATVAFMTAGILTATGIDMALKGLLP